MTGFLKMSMLKIPTALNWSFFVESQAPDLLREREGNTELAKKHESADVVPFAGRSIYQNSQ